LGAKHGLDRHPAQCKIQPEELFGEPVKRITFSVLLILLALAMSVPSVAHAPKQTRAQKDAEKSYKKYNKQYTKQQKKELKAQKKQMKQWNKNRTTVSTTG
jgi:hypothetical protein